MIYFIIILLLIVCILICLLKSAKGRGMIGELRVKVKIGKSKENEKYVLNDVLFDTSSKSCQIDHIVINKYGVFVIETKNYSGRIYGKDSQQEWTQVLQYGKVKNKLYNPVKQNKTHIYELENIIGKNVPIRSIVVFVQGNTRYIESDYVYNLSELKRVIDSPINDNRLTSDQMSNIYYSIIDKVNNSNTTNKKHIENIQTMKKDIGNNMCPRCGALLKERKSRYGTFVSCSNYPMCKFKKNYKKNKPIT